jgi:hypothetical protein
MRITSSGNLGLGVTPSAWTAYGPVFQIGNAGNIVSASGEISIGNNWYYNSGDKYVTSNFASFYQQLSGQHRWFNAPSGTAGNAISFTQAMTLTAAGRLLIGTPTEATYMLDVNGTGRFSGALSGTSASFSSSVTADSLVSNGGGQINTTVSPFVFYNSGGGGNAKKFGLNMTNLDGFKIYSLNDNGTTRKDNIIFANIDGNVGIGTSSPTDSIGYGRALDIQSATGAALYLRDSDAPTTQYGFIAYDGNDNGLKINNENSSGFIRFNTAGSERMRITSGGNVEIASGSIKTGTPSGGTAKPWKLGQDTSTLYSATRTIQVEIDGGTYYLLAVKSTDL